MSDNLDSNTLLKLKLGGHFTKELMNTLPSTRSLNAEDGVPYFYMTEEDITKLRHQIQLNSQLIDNAQNRLSNILKSKYKW